MKKITYRFLDKKARKHTQHLAQFYPDNPSIYYFYRHGNQVSLRRYTTSLFPASQEILSLRSKKKMYNALLHRWPGIYK